MSPRRPASRKRPLRSVPGTVTTSRPHPSRTGSGGRSGWSTGCDDEDALEVVDRLVGTGVATQEAVPAAFAIASLAPDDPWRACRLAARLGGDSDTVAAMAGAVVGACCGLSAFPPDAVQLVRDVNDLHLEPVVDGLLALRSGASRG